MKKNAYKKQYGFSLIETLIAVSILMIAIAGPLSLVQAGLFSSIHQRNQVTAIYLAQEALEYIKNLRDTNSYIQNSGTDRDWLAGPDDVGISLVDLCGGSGCSVDPHGTLTGGTFIQPVGSGALEPLQQYNDADGIFLYYAYGTGTSVSSFKRTVKIVPVEYDRLGSENEVTVSVRIDWTDNLMPRWYTVSENIYNIYNIDSTYNTDNTVVIPPTTDSPPSPLSCSNFPFDGGSSSLSLNAGGLYNGGFCPPGSDRGVPPTHSDIFWSSSGFGPSSCPTDATNVCKFYWAVGCGMPEEMTGTTPTSPPLGGKPCPPDDSINNGLSTIPTNAFWRWEPVQTEVFGSGKESCAAGVVRDGPNHSPNFYCTYYIDTP